MEEEERQKTTSKGLQGLCFTLISRRTNAKRANNTGEIQCGDTGPHKVLQHKHCEHSPTLGWNPSFTAGSGSFGAQQCNQRRQICREHPAGQETDTSSHIPLFTKGWSSFKTLLMASYLAQQPWISVASKCAKSLETPLSSAKLWGSAPLGWGKKPPKHDVF